jgi:light-regulated signal transduction histidine kinase (bacteriophytochrome)
MGDELLLMGKHITNTAEKEQILDLLIATFEDYLRAKQREERLLKEQQEQERQAALKLARQAEELARSNGELEQFATVASHDLQEPLRKVVGFCQLLQQHYQGKLDTEADRLIDRAVEAAQRMRALIADLLAYSRVGKQAQAFAPTNCVAVFDAAVANLQTAIQESGAQVTRSDLPTVWGNATLLGQVFQNLVGNAIKFRRDQPPQIHVAVERQPGDWLFSFRDNGIGIDSRQTERIFEIFQRLHSRQQYPGTGIGLAICKKVVERHGGRISVDSEPGHGSVFSFTIPFHGEDGKG